MLSAVFFVAVGVVVSHVIGHYFPSVSTKIREVVEGFLVKIKF